jgi:ABC-type transport system substrate-binding protein
MPEYWNRFKTIWSQTTESVQSFLSQSWPINWSNFNKFSLVSNSIVHAPYALKIVFYGSILGTVISASFFSFQVYLEATELAAEQGGTFHEAVVASEIQRLNPVLETGSEVEQKINSLIYHPLYRLEHPNFLTSNDLTPKIVPILLTGEPEWVEDTANPSDDFQILRFELKPDLQWSDGSDFTVDDVIYSFNRIREEGGNANFRSLFINYEMVASSDNDREFFIRPLSAAAAPNPYLKYLANFSPISETFYEGRTNTELLAALKSVNPTVTSGYFTFEKQVIDPLNPRNAPVPNPIESSNGSSLDRLILSRNPVQNTQEEVFIDNYVIHFRNTIQGGDESIQSLSANNQLDYFQRFLSPDSGLNSTDAQQSINLQQQTRPSNTYFNLFLNIRTSGGGFRGYFINQTLRKYVICKFYNFDLSSPASQYVTSVPQNQRIIPLQLGETFDLDCGDIDNELSTLTNSAGRTIYGIDSNSTGSVKRVTLFGRPFGESPNKLTMVGLQEFQTLGQQVQTQLLDIGLPVDAEWLSAAELEQRIQAKNYHFLFLPVTLVNNNLYPLYGNGARNVSAITNNERVDGQQVEADLLALSQTDNPDVEVRQRVVNFFANEYASITLFQGMQEVNYSTRINKLEENIPPLVNFVDDLYRSAPAWFTERKRVLRF